MSMQTKVEKFMRKNDLLKMAVPLGTQPHSSERLNRIRLMTEELTELIIAMHEGTNIEMIADAIGDLLYVVIGTAIIYDIPVNKVFNEIHRSNMTKSNLNAHGKGGKDFKFEPPRLYEVLNEGSS